MNDEEVVQSLECRWRAFSSDDLKEYIKLVNKSPNDFLFGIFLKENNRHIGNIKIGEIHPIHRFGNLGLLIGENDCRGKGYGEEAIRLATKYAFNDLNLNKLVAHIYCTNKDSINAFEKAGYREVGIFERHRFYNGNYINALYVEKCR